MLLYNFEEEILMNLIPRGFLFDDFFDSFGKMKICDMKCDIYEEGDNYVFLVDVPGYSKDEIDVDVDRGYLTISVNRVLSDESLEKTYISKERFYGTTRRQFYVGDVDEDMIKASFNDGVLKVIIPKKEEVFSKKKIEIE